jgi:hypothetical protein
LGVAAGAANPSASTADDEDAVVVVILLLVRTEKLGEVSCILLLIVKRGMKE